MARAAALFAALVGALLWALLAAAPPDPVPASAPAAVFSAERAFIDLAAISRAPRPTGSAENARARAYLAQRLRATGADVSEQRAPLPADVTKLLDKWSGQPGQNAAVHNLIGVIAGRDRTKPALLLMAHHDSVSGSPGAADDAMGVAVSIEAARALIARGRPERDLILLFTDGEEVGLNGAKAFFAGHPLAARIGAIINMEARGAGGRATMFETGPGNGALMRLYADEVERPSTSSLAVLVYDLMPNSTDYTIAKAKGIAGFNFAVLGRPETYHSPMATPENVDRGSLQDMGDQVLALAAGLAFAAELPPRAANAAFGDLMGRVTLVYPVWLGWTILIASAAAIGLALRRMQPARRALGARVAITLAMLMHGMLLLTAINAVSGSGGADYYDRLAALPRLEIMAALAIAALVILTPHFRRSWPRPAMIAPAMLLMWAGLLTGGPLILLVLLGGAAMLSACALPRQSDDRGEGAILLLLGAGLLFQLTLPTAAPLLHWPLLLAALALAARAFLPGAAGLVATALAGAAGLGHLFAQSHFIFLGIGADWPAVWIITLFAGLPLLLPLLPERLPRRPAGAALTGALILALWIRLDPIAPTIPTYVAQAAAN